MDREVLLKNSMALAGFRPLGSLIRIGIQRVKSLGIEIVGISLISTTDYPNCPQRKVGEYYIRMGLAPGDMRNRLKQIAEQLGILLHAKLFP